MLTKMLQGGEIQYGLNQPLNLNILLLKVEVCVCIERDLASSIGLSTKEEDLVHRVAHAPVLAG